MGWVFNATLRPLYPRERPGTHWIGGWVDPRTGLDGCGKYRPHRDSNPGPSSPQRVVIQSELSRPIFWPPTQSKWSGNVCEASRKEHVLSLLRKRLQMVWYNVWKLLLQESVCEEYSSRTTLVICERMCCPLLGSVILATRKKRRVLKFLPETQGWVTNPTGGLLLQTVL
jgi:hypothetical protein